MQSELTQWIGQMLIMGFQGKLPEETQHIRHAIQKLNLGGVILFDYDGTSKTFDRNIASPSQVKTLNRSLHQANLEGHTQHSRPFLPLLIGVDYEGGYVNRLHKKYGFPEIHSQKLVASKGKAFAKATGLLMAKTLKENGFNLNFSPLVDVNLNPENPIIAMKDRSFSASPALVSEFAKVYVNAYSTQQIISVLKHFPGHGSANNDSHLGFVDVTEVWKESELEPYQRLLQGDLSSTMIMTAHVINRKLDPSGLPATLSNSVVTNLLRKKLGYQGVVVSDDMQMGAISEHYGHEESLVRAINAGVDMFIFGNNLGTEADAADIIHLIHQNVQKGHINPETIESTYQRIRHLKRSI